MTAESSFVPPEPEHPQPPKLEFRPDKAKESRVRKFRIVTLGLAFLVLVVSLVWLIAFRPRFHTAAAGHDFEPTAEVETARLPPATAPVPVSVNSPTSSTRDVVSSIEAQVAEAKERWRRAATYIPLSMPGPGQLEEAVARVRRAVVVAESAAVQVVVGLELMVKLRQALLWSRVSGYRASNLSSAADEFLLEARNCAEEMLEHYRAQEQAYVALTVGDSAEFEIKSNVATGYLRKAESAERRLGRAQERLRAALAELER